MTNSGHNPIPDTVDGGSGTGGSSGASLPGDRVEWSRNTILAFIEDYRGYRVLWDPNTKGYHVKQIKYEALKRLSRKYGTEVRIIRSKIKSLRSSFHREHGKVISGKRRGIKYQPMWFAYEAIRFILDGEQRDEMGEAKVTATAARSAFNNGDVDGGGVSGAAVVSVTAAGADTASVVIDANDELLTLTHQFDDPHYASISAEDVKTEILETSMGEIEDLKSTVQRATNFDKLLRKRKRQTSKEHSTLNGFSNLQQPMESDSDDEQSSLGKMKRRMETESRTDEYGVFGEYVGITIRKLKTTKARVVIKHLINNLLYEAEIGRYDFGIPTSREPPHLYATAD